MRLGGRDIDDPATLDLQHVEHGRADRFEADYLMQS